MRMHMHAYAHACIYIYIYIYTMAKVSVWPYASISKQAWGKLLHIYCKSVEPSFAEEGLKQEFEKIQKSSRKKI